MKKGVDILRVGVRYWRKSRQRRFLRTAYLQNFSSLYVLPFGALVLLPVFAERIQASLCTGTANPGRSLNQEKRGML